MLDEYARGLIETASLPSQLAGEDARDLVSRSYLHWLATGVLGAHSAFQAEDYPEVLSRLSLASSLLASHDENLDPTAFLIAESADVARLYAANSQQELSAAVRFQRAVHYLDLAGFFHLADYDANAGIAAKEAIALLDFPDLVTSNVTSETHLSYYRSLAFFLLGRFADCRSEAHRTTEARSAEERAFRFLRVYLAGLTDRYKDPEFLDPETEHRIGQLSDTLKTQDHPYYALSAEVVRLLQFSSAVERKSLYRMLLPVLTEEQGFLEARISSDDNNGYPFAWPPAHDFSEEYLSEKASHAVITIPTGAGKGFLAELAVAQALQKGWVLYLAPTNALCAQIKDDLRRNLAPLAGFGVEAFLGKAEYTEELPLFQIPKQVLAITPEKALLLLKREPDRFKNCSLVILDECQLLGSSNRGDIAEVVIAFSMAQNPAVRIILTSALVSYSDGKKLAQWLQQRTMGLAAHITLPWRPTRTARIVVLPDWDTFDQHEEDGKVVASVEVRAYADTVTPWEEQTPLVHWPLPVRLEHSSRRFPWRNVVSRKLAELLVGGGIPTLLFVLHSRHHAFSIAKDFEADLSDRPTITQREQDLYAVASYELGADSLLEMLVDQKGVGVHTAIMLDCERQAAEIAFATGRALLLNATGTLSQGLNLVARAVIICGTHLSVYGDGEDISQNELDRISLNQVLNAAGRAARASVAVRGTSIIVPDSLTTQADGLNQEAPKEQFLSKWPVLGRKEGSLSVNSPLEKSLKDTSQQPVDADVRRYERSLLSRLPVDSKSLAATVRNLLGAYELREDDSLADRVINRLEIVKMQAISSGNAEWILNAASLAGLNYDLAANLKAYIESRASEPGIVPPDDTYTAWANFLIGWLRALPASETWQIVQMHSSAWRYSWGQERDSDLIEALQREGYPDVVSPTSLDLLEPIWKNMIESVQAWLDDKTLIGVSQVLTRRSCAPDKQVNRTHAGHYIPRAIIWIRSFIDRLARFAGLMLALQNQWIEHEPSSIPNWFANTKALPTLPLGIRFGVRDPFALAWHRHLIQERRAANLLQRLTPLKADSITDLQEARKHVDEATNVFLSTESSDEEFLIVSALRRLACN